MAKTDIKRVNWLKKRLKTKYKIKNTKGAYTRLVVFRSNKHIYSQLIDDNLSKTLLSCSTKDKTLSSKLTNLNKIEQSKVVGSALGDEIKKKKIKKIVFDRNGYRYHGRVKALADAIREKGVNF